ncbi:MAG TPA: MucR family transcriptional regulator, partial [Candidatus Sulfotelmatobacter sp.]
YFARWQLPPDHPITAPGYSVRRSAMAKLIGLGRGRKTANAAPPAEPEPAPPNKPRRRSRPHQAPTTESSTS